MGKIHVWSNSKDDWEAIPFSRKETHILNKIRELVEQLEQYQNTHPKKHPIIALLKELVTDPIAPSYVQEKIKLLFM
ncbi:MAG: hypothetical protein DRP09_12995 [Candidatus Thorarchaeota archaeon]|nr:MAG: hypothetical protein DRP09_12995 [Candidatus Thorarchaeota archaeon]